MTQEEIISELREQLAASSDKVIALLAEVRAARQALNLFRARFDGLATTAAREYWQPVAAALASPSVPPPQEKGQEAGETPAPLACYHCGQPLYGPAGCIHCKDHHRPAPPVLEEKAQETAALKEGKGVVPSDPTAEEIPGPVGTGADEQHAGRSATPGAVSQQPGAAPAPFGGVWIGEVRPTAEALAAAQLKPTAGPPKSPAPLPTEEVAPGPMPLVYLACPYSHADRAVRVGRFEAANVAASALMRGGLKVFSPISHTHPIAEAGGLPLGWEFWEAYDRAYIGHSCKVIVLRVDGWRESKGVQAEIRIAGEYGIPVEYIDPAPILPLEEQLPKEGSAAAPAPGDADRAEARDFLEKLNYSSIPVAFVTDEFARVRSEERAGIVEEINSYRGRLAANEAYNAKKLSAVDAILSRIRIRARASDATSAGGGE